MTRNGITASMRATVAARPIHVTHMITCLNPGGAENMLYRLLAATDRANCSTDVVSLMGVGILGERLRRELGIRVRALGLDSGFPNPMALFRLIRWLRADPPDVLATWMYHANLLGSVAAAAAGGIPVVWGLHHSKLDPSIEKQRTIRIARASGWLSHRYTARIICCSEATRQEHLRLGYDPGRLEVICNGFDTTALRPDPCARLSVRAELGLPPHARIVTLAARFHAQKDHRNFLQAGSLLLRRVPDTWLLMCGQDVRPENILLAWLIREVGLEGRALVLGSRDDVGRLFAASNAACLSSVEGEAFPLAIGEAMACGVPCVVTDVGDSGFLVGDTGFTVPPRNPGALANALATLLEMPAADYRVLSERARARVKENFELSRIAERYHDVYRRAAGVAPAAAHPEPVAGGVR
jgi:glycosyltransferase involved in cell wall biosynthesis